MLKNLISRTILQVSNKIGSTTDDIIYHSRGTQPQSIKSEVEIKVIEGDNGEVIEDRYVFHGLELIQEPKKSDYIEYNSKRYTVITHIEICWVYDVTCLKSSYNRGNS